MTKSPQRLPDSATLDSGSAAQLSAGESAKPKRPRRMARQADVAPSEPVAGTAPTAPVARSKLDQIQLLLRGPEGATIADLVAATGWQAHSVRGAMAGALKKRGLTITSERIDGLRRYRANPIV